MGIEFKSFNVLKNVIAKVTIANQMRGIKYYVKVRSNIAVSGKSCYVAWNRVKIK